MELKYKIIIPVRANSKRLPGKNMRLLRQKPLIQYSIDFAINNFSINDIWVNSDDREVIEFAKKQGIMTLLRPDNLATDEIATVDVLKNQVMYFRENNIDCDAIILLQATNPFREDNLLKIAIDKFEKTNRKSLATFTRSESKLGKIENNFFFPTNYKPGQRSQDLEKSYYENGLLYITKCDSILAGAIMTADVFPLICENIESSVDIDYLEDFIFAETLLKLKYDEK